MKLLIVITFCLFAALNLYSQVGIGTITPDPSAILDVKSSSQGLLAPRMTTVERLNINSPAQGLLVYDLDEDRFYHYNSTNTSWNELITDAIERKNYVLVKSEADFPAAAGGKITLDSSTLYEINGAITLSNPIDINGSYIEGVDTNEDKLIASGGTVFSGAKGGSIRNVTLSAPGGTIFNLNATAAGENLVFQSAVVVNSSSVGTISGFNLVFMNVIQYVYNSAGITYTNIDNLLLNNQGWFSTNGGTYETLTGDFDLVSKVSGFSQVVAGGTVGLDVTGVSTITGDADLQNVVFYGGGKYVNGVSPYNGFNFTRDWSVDCPGIPVELDDNAAANFYFNGALTTGFAQSVSNNSAVKITGTSNSNNTTANSLFRFNAPVNNRLVYDGTKTRDFQVNASLSIRVENAAGNFFAFIIAKNGSIITESNAVVRIDSDVVIQNVALNSIVTLETGDYVELYVQRLTGSGTDNLVVFSENLSIK
ncbi:MAG: cell wall anchor protein [Leeuwenhoekiella sp.]